MYYIRIARYLYSQFSVLTHSVILAHSGCTGVRAQMREQKCEHGHSLTGKIIQFYGEIWYFGNLMFKYVTQSKLLYICEIPAALNCFLICFINLSCFLYVLSIWKLRILLFQFYKWYFCPCIILLQLQRMALTPLSELPLVMHLTLPD